MAARPQADLGPARSSLRTSIARMPRHFRPVTFRTSAFRQLAEYSNQPREIPVSDHFTLVGGSLIHEAPGFSPAPRRRAGSLALWGFVLASLLFAVTTAAAVTATSWASGAIVS